MVDYRLKKIRADGNTARREVVLIYVLAFWPVDVGASDVNRDQVVCLFNIRQVFVVDHQGHRPVEANLFQVAVSLSGFAFVARNLEFCVKGFLFFAHQVDNMLFTVGDPKVALVVNVERVTPVDERRLIVEDCAQGVPLTHSLALNVRDLVEGIVLTRPHQRLRKSAQ